MRTLTIIVATAASTIVACWYLQQKWGLLGPAVEGPSATVGTDLEGRRDIYAIGRLQPASGVITIAATPGQRLEVLSVQPGQLVRADQSLGELADYVLLKKKVELLRTRRVAAAARQAAERQVAAARVQQAELVLTQAREQRDEQLGLQQQQLEVLKNKYETLHSQAEGLQRLREGDPELVSAAELRQQQLLVEKTHLEWQQAELDQRLAPARADRAVESAAADVQAAEAALQQIDDATSLAALDAEIDVAAQQLRMAELRAPRGGTVLSVDTDPGEFITHRPILQIADLTRMICVAEVYESDAKRVRVGQTVRIHSPAFVAPFDTRGLQGVVRRVGQQVTAPGVQDLNPLAPTARHVVEVDVEVTDEAVSEDQLEAFQKSSQMGDLQVDVAFENNE